MDIKRRATDRQKWRDAFNLTNILLTILIAVSTAFLGYLISDIKDVKSELAEMKKCVQEQYTSAKDLIITHIAWHKGKDKPKL